MLVQVSADIVHHKKAFGRLIIQNISMTASRILQTLARLSQHDIRLVLNLRLMRLIIGVLDVFWGSVEILADRGLLIRLQADSYEVLSIGVWR